MAAVKFAHTFFFNFVVFYFKKEILKAQLISGIIDFFKKNRRPGYKQDLHGLQFAVFFDSQFAILLYLVEEYS